ncbi:MAG TPA: SDR family oxidoreductase [Thermoanaerobaculia bacterium]|nr:SDR family oxidoreductase [Thermoanaerobaculia bacterium]
MGTVLVTGGSRGIGRAVVEALLAGTGEAVAFTWSSQEAAAREVEAASGGRARAFHLDLADRSRPDDLVSEVEEALGPVSGLVNNAGIRRESLLALTPDTDWDAVVDSNLGGLFRCCRAVLRGMMTRRRGAIVNVSSLSALHGVAGQAAYAASKAGILGLTRSLAREVGKRNVRVNAVVPGFVATDLTAGLPEAAVAVLRAGECLPGGVSAPMVAEAVLFLLSDRASGITGQTLVVDAGASA